MMQNIIVISIIYYTVVILNAWPKGSIKAVSHSWNLFSVDKVVWVFLPPFVPSCHFLQLSVYVACLQQHTHFHFPNLIFLIIQLLTHCKLCLMRKHISKCFLYHHIYKFYSCNLYHYTHIWHKHKCCLF